MKLTKLEEKLLEGYRVGLAHGVILVLLVILVLTILFKSH